MIKIHRDKREHSTEYLIPMKDENNANVLDPGFTPWVYYCDGKRHGRVPVMVLHGTEDIWGGEEYIRSLGYRKHWCIFLDEDAGEFTFGNRASYAKSPYPEDQVQAHSFPVVDINLLHQL